MNQLVQFIEREGKDASELDEAVADYMVQLAGEGGTEDEVWSVMEGCYPDLEEVRPGMWDVVKLISNQHNGRLRYSTVEVHFGADRGIEG